MRQQDFQQRAEALASAFAGERVREIRRFPTGAQHFVFEAIFARRAPFVVRLSRPADRQLAAGALRLSAKLRTLGLPLPEIFASGVDAPVPYLIMERLPGVDLGEVVTELKPQALRSIARSVADAQAAVAQMARAGRFGFAVEASEAPFRTWTEFVRAHVHRSSQRVHAAGLFSPGHATRLEAQIDRRRSLLDRIAAIPFLHDTTMRNVIVANGRLSGIVDVDDLGFGDPRYVVALTHAALIAMQAPADYVTAWMDEAGWRADDIFALYTAAYLLDLMSEHGLPANGNERPSTTAARAHLEAEFALRLEQLER